MTEYITEKMFTEALHAVVAEKGRDYRYTRPRNAAGVGMCRYVTEDGAPDCLIGHVLFAIDKQYGTHFTPDFHCLIGVNSLLWNKAEPEVVDAAQLAQYTQDSGGTWGAAMDRYDKYIESVIGAKTEPTAIITTDTTIQSGVV